jgi:hypothetical protein
MSGVKQDKESQKEFSFMSPGRFNHKSSISSPSQSLKRMEQYQDLCVSDSDHPKRERLDAQHPFMIKLTSTENLVEDDHE